MSNDITTHTHTFDQIEALADSGVFASPARAGTQAPDPAAVLMAAERHYHGAVKQWAQATLDLRAALEALDLGDASSIGPVERAIQASHRGSMMARQSALALLRARAGVNGRPSLHQQLRQVVREARTR